MSERIELLIIGAGWNGLTMAKTYHEAYPETSILVMDTGDSLGGTWARERVYPSLKTNNVVSSYEFSDFPMTPEKYGVTVAQKIPGLTMHRYLCDAAKHFDIEKFLRLRSKAECARLREDGLWEVMYSRTFQPSSRGTVVATKLVLAFGLTSEPLKPRIPGQDDFSGLLMHSKQLSTYLEKLSQAKKVVVVGGNKSAWDTCYLVARSGGTAHMVLRPSGGGPTRAFPPRFDFFGKSRPFALITIMRIFTMFDPWPFDNKGSLGGSVIRWFLHKSILGLIITRWFWTYLDKQIAAANRYNDYPGAEYLEPWCSTFWLGCSLSALNYETNFFEEVKNGNIVVHRAEVLGLSQNGVSLSDGMLQDVDAVVSCTGWSSIPPLRLEPPELQTELGLPRAISPEDDEKMRRYRQKIITERPLLAGPPRAMSGDEGLINAPLMTPYSLYRFVIPTSKRFLDARNIAFIGIFYALHVVPIAQTQALWITAFFNDKIPHLQPGNIEYNRIADQAILHSQYERLRRPKQGAGFGEKFPDLVFDTLPYLDMLLSDLGMRTRRKSSWWRHFFEPHVLSDYKNLVQEWLGRRKS